ncbi:MAG: CPBP family intramembrane glutamic endopeptidase [Candidatus Thorarchaeota archaeon]
MGADNIQSNDLGPIRVLLFALTLLLIHLLHEIISILTASMDEVTRGLISTIQFFGLYLLMYFAVILFMRWERSGDVTSLGFQTDEKTIRHLIVGLIAGTVGAALVYVIALLFGGDIRPAVDITGDLIANQIIFTIPVALFEEIVYRGYLMTRMERVVGQSFAILGSSLLFALLHFSWWLPLGSIPLHLILIFTFNLFLGGVVLGYSYYWSDRRLWVPIAFHYAWNIVAFVLFPVYPIEPVNMVEIFQIEWGITTVFGFLFGLSLIWVLELLKNK